jgi:hypothetical protein
MALYIQKCAVHRVFFWRRAATVKRWRLAGERDEYSFVEPTIQLMERDRRYAQFSLGSV